MDSSWERCSSATLLTGGTSPSLSYGVIKEIKLQTLQSQTLRILIILDMFLFQKTSLIK